MDDIFNALFNYKLIQDAPDREKEVIKVLNKYGIYGFNVSIFLAELMNAAGELDDE